MKNSTKSSPIPNTNPLLRHLWYPCSQMKDYEAWPPVLMERGKGVYLFDSAGKKYIDAISSWWVNLFGHSHPRLNRVLAKQASRLEHVLLAGCTHRPALDYADALIKKVPAGLSRVFFADNGSSAVEAALKMSFQYNRQTGRGSGLFVALSGAYHGETVGALSVGGMDLYRKVYAPMLMRTEFARAPSCTECPFHKTRETCKADCFQYLEQTVERAGAERISGIIIEPLVQCANRMNMYPPVYLKKLAALCRRENIHFIADEIAVGFGRTGRLFACEHAGVRPDFLCLSKGITGGYMPFSAVVTTEKVYQAFYADAGENKAFLHSHSYTGNPLAAALALEVLTIFREECVLETLPSAMAHMSRCLAELGALPCVRNVRQTGLIAAFDLVNGETGRPFKPELRMGRRAAKAAVSRGALLRPLGDTLYFMPPLVIRNREMTALAEKTSAALREVMGRVGVA